jgi:hypothetical protein
LREEPLFLDAKVRIELAGDAFAQIAPRPRQRGWLRMLFHREPDAPRQHERPVMIIRERLKERMPLHVSAALPVDARARENRCVEEGEETEGRRP